MRDLLLGREPKDFDVVTDARPEEVKRLFRNCRLIGRRFRLAHVRFGPEIIEVATFRGHPAMGEENEGATAEGRIVRDNVYGTFDEDAERRDFTINSLYYDIRDFSLVDTRGGLEDLNAGLIRLIGVPETRFREDPVRMLRAVRFAAKLGFRIHPETEAAIPELAFLLRDVPPARLFDEVLKLFHGGCALQTFELLRHIGLFGELFPETQECLAEESEGYPKMVVARALENTDQRILADKPVTPAFLFAALLWEPMRRRAEHCKTLGHSDAIATAMASRDVIAAQAQRISLPRRFSTVTQEIWSLQARFPQMSGKRPLRLLEHPRFRAAYDFLLLRNEAGEDLSEQRDWWTRFQEAEANQRSSMLKPMKRRGRRRRPRSKALA